MLLLAVLDVVLDGLTGRGAHGPIEVPPTPESLPPELHPHPAPARLTDPPGGCALESSDDLRHAVVPAGPHEDMDVVRPKGQGVDDHAQLLRGLPEALLADRLDHLVPEDAPPVLRRELQVQVGLTDTVVSPHQLH